MRSIADIVTRFGGPTAFGRYFAVSRNTVNTWRRRNFFPPERDVELVEEAQRRKIPLTYEHLAKLRRINAL